MILAHVLTPWTGTGSANTPYRPKLLVDHPLPLGARFADATGQPGANLVPAPNLYVIEVTAPQAWLDAVLADPAYGNAAVLWWRNYP